MHKPRVTTVFTVSGGVVVGILATPELTAILKPLLQTLRGLPDGVTTIGLNITEYRQGQPEAAVCYDKRKPEKTYVTPCKRRKDGSYRYS